MRPILPCVAFVAALCATSARGAEPIPLTEAEKAAVVKGAEVLQKAFEIGDADTILKNTHESIMKLAGSREGYEQVMRQATKTLSAQVKFESVKLTAPLVCHAGGNEEVAFVLKSSVARVEGQRVKSEGYLIAARAKGSNEWKYLDGRGVQKRPDLLWILFPELSRDVKAPPAKMELMEADAKK